MKGSGSMRIRPFFQVDAPWNGLPMAPNPPKIWMEPTCMKYVK